MITKNQEAILGNDYGIAYFTQNFKESLETIKEENKSIYEQVMAAESLSKKGKFWQFVKGVKFLKFDNETVITIYQNKGQINGCLVPLLYGVEKIVAYGKNSKTEHLMDISIFKGVSICVLEFDFENPITKLVLHFNYDLAKPLEVKVETVLYKEPPIDYDKLYLENLKPNHSTGQDLVNIRFQKANDKAVKTVISLFNASERSFNGGVVDRQLLAKYTVEEDVFFKSIKDLAYGLYSYKIAQYDKDNKLIIETDYINFRLTMPNYSGKPVVIR